MSENPVFAPGCFGLMATYSEDEICGSCLFKIECAVLHHRAKAQLQSFHGLLKKPSRQVDELPVKVSKIFEEHGKTIEEVRQEMFCGSNPYSVRAGFIGIVCHILLEYKTTTRAVIAAVLMKQKQYGATTADVYARHAIQILQHCGVAEIDGDKINLARG